MEAPTGGLSQGSRRRNDRILSQCGGRGGTGKSVTGAPAPESTLLLVDDDEGVAATLAAVLEADGYRVEVARTVGEALARIAETTFTAAVVDLNVESDDGL